MPSVFPTPRCCAEALRPAGTSIVTDSADQCCYKTARCGVPLQSRHAGSSHLEERWHHIEDHAGQGPVDATRPPVYHTVQRPCTYSVSMQAHTTSTPGGRAMSACPSASPTVAAGMTHSPCAWQRDCIAAQLASTDCCHTKDNLCQVNEPWPACVPVCLLRWNCKSRL